MNAVKCKNNHFYDSDKFTECPHCAKGVVGSVAGNAFETQPMSMDEALTGLQETVPMEAMFGDETAPAEDMNFGGAMPTEPDQNVRPMGPQETVPTDIGGFAAMPETMPAGNNGETVPAANGGETVPASDYPDSAVPDFILNEIKNDNGGKEMDLNDVIEGAAVETEVKIEDNPTVAFDQQGIENQVKPVVGWLVCVSGSAKGQAFTLNSGKNFIGRAVTMDIVLKDDSTVSRERHAIVLYDPKSKKFIAQPGESKELFYINDDVVINAVMLKNHDVIQVGNTKLIFVPLCGEDFAWEDYE